MENELRINFKMFYTNNTAFKFFEHNIMLQTQTGFVVEIKLQKL